MLEYLKNHTAFLPLLSSDPLSLSLPPRFTTLTRWLTQTKKEKNRGRDTQTLAMVLSSTKLSQLFKQIYVKAAHTHKLKHLKNKRASELNE